MILHTGCYNEKMSESIAFVRHEYCTSIWNDIYKIINKSRANRGLSVKHLRVSVANCLLFWLHDIIEIHFSWKIHDRTKIQSKENVVFFVGKSYNVENQNKISHHQFTCLHKSNCFQRNHWDHPVCIQEECGLLFLEEVQKLWSCEMLEKTHVLLFSCRFEVTLKLGKTQTNLA